MSLFFTGPAPAVAGPTWLLDCLACGRQGTVELRQDVESGELVDVEGTRAHEFVCTSCGSDDLCPTIADHPLSATALLTA